MKSIFNIGKNNNNIPQIKEAKQEQLPVVVAKNFVEE